MDTTQIFLAVTLSVTTFFLIVVGIQLFFTLRDLRKSLNKVNAIIDAFEKVGSGIEHGFEEVVGFAAGLKSFFKILDVVTNKKHEAHKK